MSGTREFFLRHAQSIGNVKGILVSNPIDGINGYGITELGRTQIRKSITQAKLNGFGVGRKVVYICSPFERAVQTAEEARLVVDGEIFIEDRLSERWFGSFDGTTDKNLRDIIWPADGKNDSNSIGGVESPADVAKRVSAVFEDAEQTFPNCDIAYVTHGDVVQIGIATYKNIQPRRHRDLPNMENAELRRLDKE